MNAELSRDGELCPACGEGHLHSHERHEQVEYNGQQGEVLLYFSVCNYCGSELAGEAESLANKRAMTAFRKSVDGLLTGEQVRAFRLRFGMSQELAAAIFGGGKVAFSRYEKDDISQSTAMDRLIRLCQRRPANIIALAEELNLALPDDVQEAVLAAGRAEHAAFIRSAREALKALSDTTPKQAKVCANDHQFERYGTANRTSTAPSALSWQQAAAA